MGDTNRIFVENAESHEVVFECSHPVDARRFLRKKAPPGTYNILGRIELGLLVEPPRQIHGNRLHGGQAFRIRASRKAQVPENNVDPDIESAVQEQA